MKKRKKRGAKPKPARIPIKIDDLPPAPLEIRQDRLWHQMCSGWLDGFPTPTEKRAVFSYLIAAMTKATELIEEINTMEELYDRTH